MRDRAMVAMGLAIRLERQRRGWSMTELARRARVSVGTVSGVEAGRRTAVETWCRLAAALGLNLEVMLRSGRRRTERPATDVVHSAMGDLEAAWLQRHDCAVSIDHPYQHYQFAGRADLVAWTLDPPALLHLENRTRFPDLQSAAGAYNAKRRYLARTLASELGIVGFVSETHAMVGLWSAEVIHAVRLRRSTFSALCPDGPERFLSWLEGEPPSHGNSSSFILLDPLATGRQRQVVGLRDVLGGVRPRVRGYAEAAQRLEQAGR